MVVNFIGNNAKAFFYYRLGKKVFCFFTDFWQKIGENFKKPSLSSFTYFVYIFGTQLLETYYVKRPVLGQGCRC